MKVKKVDLFCMDLYMGSDTHHLKNQFVTVRFPVEFVPFKSDFPVYASSLTTFI